MLLIEAPYNPDEIKRITEKTRARSASWQGLFYQKA